MARIRFCSVLKLLEVILDFILITKNYWLFFFFLISFLVRSNKHFPFLNHEVTSCHLCFKKITLEYQRGYHLESSRILMHQVKLARSQGG